VNILTRLLKWVLGLLQRRQAQTEADNAAIQRNQDDADAVQTVERAPVSDRAATADRLRRGDF